VASVAGGVVGNCFQLTQTSGAAQYGYHYFENLILGYTYTIEIWVKSGTSGDEAFRIQVWSTNILTMYAEVTGVTSSTWTKYSFDWVCTDDDPVIKLVKDTATAGTMLFDEFAIYSGDVGTADTLAIINNNFLEAYAGHELLYSDDNVTYTSLFTQAAADTLSNFVKTFTSTKARYWRLAMYNTQYAPMMAIMFLGQRLQFERYAFNYSGVDENIVAEAVKSETGNLLGSSIKFIEYNIGLSFRNLTNSWAENTFKPEWDDYLSQLKPFFFFPDLTNSPTELYYVKIPDNFKLKMPYSSGGLRRDLDLTFEGLKE
jgi:hypothetical protein